MLALHVTLGVEKNGGESLRRNRETRCNTWPLGCVKSGSSSALLRWKLLVTSRPTACFSLACLRGVRKMEFTSLGAGNSRRVVHESVPFVSFAGMHSGG